MRKRNSLVRRVYLVATFLFAASLIGGSPSLAQEADGEEALELDRIQITGSRIKRIDIEGPQPITVITRDDIDGSGDASVADVIRTAVYNSFGGFKERSGTFVGSQAQVDLRGLGPGRSLVLMDGRRVSQTIRGIGGQNLNTLPMAAVERIEILRESGSAVYGSDAIGGVINIITRKDYQGLTASARVARPTQPGANKTTGALTYGKTFARGNLVLSLDHYERDIIFNRDRHFTDLGLSSFGYLASYDVYDPASGEYLASFPDPRCPVTENGEPSGTGEFPNSVLSDWDYLGMGECLFNYNAISSWDVRSRRRTAFLLANYQLTDRVEAFTRLTLSDVDTYGVYAPAPAIGGVPLFPTMSADNPNNPTVGMELDFDGDGVADFTGPFDLDLWYRNIPGGNRDSFLDDDFIDIVAGLRGELGWFGGSEWELAVQRGRQSVDTLNLGFTSKSGLQAIIDDGSFDIFGVNGPLDAALAESLARSAFNRFETRLTGFDGTLNFDAFQLQSGPVPVALGFEYRDESFDWDFDELENSSDVYGGTPNPDVIGSRSLYSLFAETVVPVRDELELGLAVRYDEYSDFGGTVNPRANLAWRPVDSLLARATWGSGFHAPTLDDLHYPQFEGEAQVTDTKRCQESGDAGANATTLPPGHPCKTITVLRVEGGNPALEPEESTGWTLGFVWNPVRDFSIGVDYYDIEFTNEVWSFGAQSVIDNEWRAGSSDRVIRDPVTGRIVKVIAITGNADGVDTQGIELDASYRFEPWNLGEIRLGSQVAYKLAHNWVVEDNGPRVNALKESGLPDIRATLNVNWSKGAFGASVTGDYISDIPFPEFWGVGPGLPSWTQWHVQFAYDTPWGGKLRIGAENVFNRDPPTWGSNGDYFLSLHDIYGRVPYLRYEHTFR